MLSLYIPVGNLPLREPQITVYTPLTVSLYSQEGKRSMVEICINMTSFTIFELNIYTKNIDLSM